MVVSYGVNRK